MSDINKLGSDEINKSAKRPKSPDKAINTWDTTQTPKKPKSSNQRVNPTLKLNLGW